MASYRSPRRADVGMKAPIADVRRTLLRALPLMAAISLPAFADTFTVLNTADAGAGSFRQAIIDANNKQVTDGSRCAPHTIDFAIAGAGPHTIALLSPLPKINIPITFDGYSQPGSSENTASIGSNAVLQIEIDGSLAGSTDAFVVGAAIPGSPLCPGNTSVFRGLVINRFAGAAISMGEEFCPVGQFCNSGGVLIQGNYIGTDVTGTQARGNGIALARPALVFGTSSVVNVVGDQTLESGGPMNPSGATRNVISGNGADAVLIFSASSDFSSGLSRAHTIRNNYIGLDASGAAALPNAGRGIEVGLNSSAILIYDNLISANGSDGIAILDTQFGGTSVIGNGIGIGVTGQPFGNGGYGVLVNGNSIGVTVGSRFRFAPTAAAISNNAGAGVFVDDLAVVDAGNLSSAGNGGLAFDIAPAGVNPNDAGDGDSGPNERLNSPTLASVTIDPSTLEGSIVGSIGAEPNTTYEIHFFLNDVCDAGGSGGGQTPYPLSPMPSGVNVTTDASGNASFVRAAQFLPQGKFLTSLARRFSTTSAVPALIVSEFSNCVPIASSADLIFVDGFD